MSHVFRLYRSKVKHNLNSGIYNYLNHTRYTGKSVAEVMAMVDKNDLELEGNLSTILQPGLERRLKIRIRTFFKKKFEYCEPSYHRGCGFGRVQANMAY